MDHLLLVIDRPQALARIRESYEAHSAVVLEGPRQCGKTTLADLGLAHLWVVYPGEKRYDLADNITVVPAREIPALVTALKSGTVLRANEAGAKKRRE